MPTFEEDIQIEAPVDKVWSILMDVKTWPHWFPDATKITNLEEVTEGATYQWEAGKESGAGSIVSIDDDRGLIKVVARDDWWQLTHIFDLDRRSGVFGVEGDESRMRYTFEYEAVGGFLGEFEFVKTSYPAMIMNVRTVLSQIKCLVENGHSYFWRGVST